MTVVSKQQPLSPWGKAAAGAIAAMLANAAVYPIDLAKTRLQVQTKNADGKQEYKDTFDVIQKVYNAHGLRGLYAGLGGNLFGTASTNFAYFYWYSLVRSAYIKRRGSNLSTATELILGAIAGALAQLFTIPVSVVTARQQSSDSDTGFFKTAKDVIGEDGISGLWRGLKVSLILVINPSITYGSAEKFRKVLFQGRQALTTGENFVLGALSKAMATIATQPMIVAKVMQQTSKKGAKDVPQFRTFGEALAYLYKADGIKGLFKGLTPQISKGVIVQGLLLAIKDKVELNMLLLLRLLARA